MLMFVIYLLYYVTSNLYFYLFFWRKDHMSETVDKIIADYRSTGALGQDELDNGVIELCKRHSCTVVKQSLEEYIEAKGKRMENPSAYLTHIITRIAEEGVTTTENKNITPDDVIRLSKPSRPTPMNNGGKILHNKSVSDNNGPSVVRAKVSSEFLDEGVQMPFSATQNEDKKVDLTYIFPSMRRGRGRG
jgi:hypothetical protein